MSDIDDVNPSIDHHAPTPDFRAHLEREIARAYRAELLFAPHHGKRTKQLGMIIGLTMAAVVTLTIGLVLGASTSYASAEVLSERQREATASAMELSRRFAAFRLSVAHTNYERVRSDFEKGVATAAALRAAETELDTTRASVSKTEVQLRDVRAVVPLFRPSLALFRGYPVRRAAAAVGCLPSAVAASTVSTAKAQQGTPVVDLPVAATKSAETFGAIVGVRELPGGRLLVDDGAHRQIKVLDPSLAQSTVVLDSAAGSAHYYGLPAMPIFRYVGDSTLFPDQRARLVTLLDPKGAVARTLAMPTLQDVGLLRRGDADNSGRLVFAGMPPISRTTAEGFPVDVADSTPLLRADFALRRTDTVGYITRPMQREDILRPNGSLMSMWNADPLRAIDEWAVLTDGSVAIVRGHDYHVDLIRPDGERVSAPRLPFDWRPVSESEKTKLIDSVAARRVTAAENNTLLNVPERAAPWLGTGAAGKYKPGSPDRPAIDTTGGLYTTSPLTGRVLVLPPPRTPLDHVFDYYPPVRTRAAMADEDDHLWILPTTSKLSKAGELVYDVVDTKGELVQRVRVPLGRYVVGFGRGGVVYLATGSISSGFTIERNKLPASNTRK